MLACKIEVCLLACNAGSFCGCSQGQSGYKFPCWILLLDCSTVSLRLAFSWALPLSFSHLQIFQYSGAGRQTDNRGRRAGASQPARS